MATQVAPLGLRLFLEGVEVPVISSQVSIQPGAAASAAIQIVPTDSALLLLPRTLVHLFYLDNEFLDGSNPDLLTSTARNAQGQPLRLQDDQNRFTVADEQYKLLFSGEVIGINYQKTPTGRAMVLQCLDFSSYWDTCYQWYAEFAVGGDGLTDKHHNFVGAGQYLFNDVAAGTRWVIGNILNSKPENPLYKDTTGLLAGYIHLLEVIGGIRPGRKGDYRAFRGVNDFFTIAELMYKLSSMLGAVQSDKTSARMFANKAFRNWLRNGMSSAGSLVSFRDTLRIVGDYIFHEVYPNPAALYVPEGTKTTRSRPKTTIKTVVGQDIVAEVEDASSKIQGVRTNLQAGGNPLQIAPSDSFSILAEAANQLREISNTISSSRGSDASKLNTFVSSALRIVEEVKLSFDLSSGVGYDGTDYFVASGTAATMEARLGDAQDELTRVVSGATVRQTVSKNVEVTVGEHLFNQLLLPETFFVSPPRCNVLFPDMYSSFSFSRNFLREVSRLACQGGLGMIAQGSGSKILGRHYFAPNIKANDKVVRKTVFSSGTTLMPHEVHSGIIPKFEWVTDGHRWGVQASKGKGQLTQQKKIHYIQRLANFQFFTHRWMARQMSVTGRFNPHMVIGFPGVVVDRTSPNIGAIAAVGGRIDVSASLLPTAYVGKVATLQHNVHQNGGETAVVYTHCRTHKGADDEFLGVVKRESVEESIDTITCTPADLLENLSQGLNVDDLQFLLVQLWIKGRLIENAEISVGRIGTITGASNPDLEVTQEEARLFGVSADDVSTLKQRQSDIQGNLSNAANVFLPSSLQVQIQSRPREGQPIPVAEGGPFEEIVRPGWYSPEVWDNKNITAKVYGPLLGTTAITDDVTIADPSQFLELMNSAISASESDARNTTVEQTDPNTFVLKIDGVVAGTAHYNFTGGGSVETAIDGLTMMYGILKKNGLETQRFIDDFVKRPIANMVEILGDSDFQLDSEGNVRTRDDGTDPFEGFHSRAFGPYNTNVQFRAQTTGDDTPPKAGDNALLGLIPSDQEADFIKTGTIVNRAKDGKKTKVLTPIPKHLDPRGRAQARVRIYVDELKFSRGILGS